jgi:hypothetical protein
MAYGLSWVSGLQGLQSFPLRVLAMMPFFWVLCKWCPTGEHVIRKSPRERLPGKSSGSLSWFRIHDHIWEDLRKIGFLIWSCRDRQNRCQSLSKTWVRSQGRGKRELNRLTKLKGPKAGLTQKRAASSESHSQSGSCNWLDQGIYSLYGLAVTRWIQIIVFKEHGLERKV